MTRRTLAVPLFLALTQPLSGCASPTGPSPAPPLAPPPVATFTDRGSGFSTKDLRDVDEQIFHFNPRDYELIWAATGARFPGYTGASASVYIYSKTVGMEIRFGTKGGERRAYLTWLHDTDLYYPGKIVNIEVVGDQLVITPSDVSVPGD